MAQKTGPKPKQLEPYERMGIPVGRDKTHIDPEEIEKLSALGVTTVEMADFFGVKEQTLRYNFSDNIQKGRANLKITLRRSMLQNAHNMNASVQIFLAKNLLGMADQPINTESNQILPWNESHQQDQTHQSEAHIGKTATLQVRVD
tara:strand:+ start:3093 stop:3530 length:438 start_codon:yes stop_codon:yes gene_type:complete